MSFCVFVQYLISNLRCLTTFLTCVEKLTIWEKFEFVQNIGFHHFLDVPWGTKSKKFSNRIVHFILRLIVFWWEGFFWAEWKCNCYVVGGGISLGHNLKIKSSLQSWRGFGICPNHKYSARSDVWQIEQKLKKDFIFSQSPAP